MRDRRRFHRWDCSLECRCWGDGFEFEATLTNLSFNGSRVYPKGESPPEGAEIELVLADNALEDALKGKSLKGRVVSIYDNGECFGIEFYGKWDDRVEILMPVFQKYVKVE